MLWCVFAPQVTAGYQISTLIFWFLFWGTLFILATDGKVLSHLGFMSNVLSGPLTDLSTWVGFCTSSPQQNIKYQLWYFYFFFGGTILISEEKLATDGKVLSHPRIRSNVLPGPLTDISSCVGICISSPQQGVKYQVWYLDCVRGTLCIFTISSLTEFINECIQALM